MVEKKHAEAIYHGIEKVYRLVGFYNGQLRQIEKHLKFLEIQLSEGLQSLSKSSNSLRFDIFMLSVYCDGEEIFRTKEGENTLSYLLFKEGVKSIIFSSLANIQDVADWSLKIRAVIFEDQEELIDLASSFWKNPNPRIRLQFFNNLSLTGGDFGRSGFGVRSDDESLGRIFDAMPTFSEGQSGGSADSPAGDDSWQIPNKVSHSHEGTHTFFNGVEVSDQLRRELESYQVSDRASQIVQFQPEEIKGMISEILAYDENHIEYNSLCDFFWMIDQSSPAPPELVESISHELLKILESLFRRFHGGLILLFLKKLDSWSKRSDLNLLNKMLAEKTKNLLSNPQSFHFIARMFKHREKIELAERLMRLSNPKDFEAIFLCVELESESEALQSFLHCLLPIFPDFEFAPQTWGPNKLKFCLSELVKMEWEPKNRFLIRCLRSKNKELSQAGASFLALFHLETDLALKVFSGLSREALRQSLNSFLREPANASWKDFMKHQLSNRVWITKERELSLLWIEVFLKYLGADAVRFFDPFVSERRFVLWPAYPDLRANILWAVIHSKDASVHQATRDWIAREKKLIFQPRDLREMMMRWRK